MIGKIHHLELYVSDLEVTKAFWGWLLGDLGYDVYQEWDNGISYALGESYIVFVQVDSKHSETPYHRCKVGLNHIAFHADSKDFIDGLTQKLRTKGAKILYEDRHPYAGGEDYYALFFEDPDRIKVEVALSPSTYNEDYPYSQRAAQGQLDAYNARNVDEFMRWYTDDIIAYEEDGIIIFEGKAAMEDRYTKLFSNEGLHCELINRMIMKNRVIDHERIVRKTGSEPFEAIAIYDINDEGLIKSVRFVRESTS